jgi:hypothetical protein
MKNLAKLIVSALFGLSVVIVVLSNLGHYRIGSLIVAQAAAALPTPTPVPDAKPAAGGDKTIPKSFVLGKDSLDSKWGEVAFDHDSHAFKNYSPDGKSPIACTECHHTDQPKSALKPPLSTSERTVALTMDVFKSSTQKVNNCRACHFQDGNVEDGKKMPSATYTDGGKSTTKELNNQLAYHINCNVCHDAAFALRPELKKKQGFATTKDCGTCHKPV